MTAEQGRGARTHTLPSGRRGPRNHTDGKLRIIILAIVAVLAAAGCGGSNNKPTGLPSIAAYVQTTQTHSPEQCHPVKVTNPLYSAMTGYQCVSTGPASQPVDHLKGVPGPVPTVTYWLHLRGTPIIAKTVLDATWLMRS